MAKRKRLTPPDPDRLDRAAPETKAAFPMGVARYRPKAPISDVARDSAAAAALDELSRSWEEARATGRMVLQLPLDEIVLDHLQRDRVALDPEEMETLKQSLMAHGQQTPIEVVELPEGGFGLVSGWRRCQALRALHDATGADRFARVDALLRRPGDAGAAYRAMVEENEIRADLSHYERARIVLTATAAGVFEDTEAALKTLFGAVPRARRSKIRSFLMVVESLDGVLRFPCALSERAGLDLARQLREAPEIAAALRQALKDGAPEDAEAEARLIAGVVAARKKARAWPEDTRNPGASVPLAAFPGVTLRRDRDGGLVLSGPAADAALQADLVDWLTARLTG